jgi:hypothetical protein
VAAVLDTVAILYPLAANALATLDPIFLPVPKISATGEDMIDKDSLYIFFGDMFV